MSDEAKSITHGGARNGAGRKPGGRNLITREAIAKGENGLSPLDYLLQVMRDEKEDKLRRFDAARAAAPYCHARLQHIRSDYDCRDKMRLSVALTSDPNVLQVRRGPSLADIARCLDD